MRSTRISLSRLRFPAPQNALLALLAAWLPSAHGEDLVFQGGNWDDVSANWRNPSNNLVPYFNSTDTTPVFNGPISVFLSVPRTTGSMTLSGGVTFSGTPSGGYLVVKGGGEINSVGGVASTFNNRVLVFPGPGTLSLKGQLVFNNTIEAGAGQLVAVSEGVTTLGAGAVLTAATLQVGSATGPFVILNGGAGTGIVTTGNMIVGQTPTRTGIVNTTGTNFNIGGDMLLAHNANCDVTINGGSLSIGGALRIADSSSFGNPLPNAVLTLRNTTLTVSDSGGAGIRGTFFTTPGDIGVLPSIQLPGTRVQTRPGGFLTIDGQMGMGVNNTIFDTTNGDIRIDARLWGKALIKEGPGILKLTRDNRNGGGGGGTLDGTIVRGGFIEFSNSGNLNDGGSFNLAANPGPTTGLKNIQLNGGGLRWAAGSSEDISARFRLLNNFSFDTNGNNVTFATTLAGTGGMTKVGEGILKLASGSTYTGGTTVKGGYLEFAAASAFGPTPVNQITLDGGGLRWAPGNSADISSRLNPLGGNGGRFDTNGNDVTLAAGSIGGVGQLAKFGAGKLTLQGTHSWTGGLVVNGGTVALKGTFNGQDHLAVGDVGNGALSITNSSLTSTTYVRIGAQQGVSGTADVGLGASLNAGTFLEVGSGGLGTLNVKDGGQVASAASVALGVLPGSAGEINVSGLGGAVGTQPATLDVGTTLYVAYHGTGTLNIGSGGEVNVGGQLRFAEIAGSSGAVVLNTGGTLKIGGADGIRGGGGTFGLALAGGTLKVTGSDLTTSVPMTLTNNSVIDTGGWSAGFDGALSGTGGITKRGAGILYLNAVNTYGGGTQVDGGQLVVPSANSLSGGPIDVFNGSLHSNSTLSRDVPITVDGPSSSLSAASFIEIGVGGAGSLTVTNGGTVSTPGSVAFAVLPGGTTGSASVTGAGSSLTSGTTIYLGYLGSGSVTVGNGGSVTVGGQINLGTGTSGAGTFNLNPGGTLNIGGVDGIVKGVGTATFNLAGGTLKVAGADLSSSVPMTLTNNTSIDTNGLSASLSGTLTGTGGLAKTGAGTLTLGQTNSYSGGTIIHAGRLAVGVAGALPDSSPVDLEGGTLALSGFSETAGTLKLGVDSIIDLGAGASSLQFADSSSLEWTGVLTITGYTVGEDTLRFGTDQAALTEAQLAMIRFADYGNATGVIDSQGFVTIPEPGSVALVLPATLLLCSRRRRREISLEWTKA